MEGPRAQVRPSCGGISMWKKKFLYADSLYGLVSLRGYERQRDLFPRFPSEDDVTLCSRLQFYNGHKVLEVNEVRTPGI